MVAILRCFEVVSGLEVIFFKSELIGIFVEDHTLQDLASIMGWLQGRFASLILSGLASLPWKCT